MPTLTQIRNIVDSRLATLWTNQVLPREAAYLAANGRYWQGIITNTLGSLPNNPNDGNNVALEIAPNLNAKPTDQATSWTGEGVTLEATIPMALAIDTYDGPQGKGFVGHVWAKWNGNTYHRAQNSGPETYRTQAWHLLPATIP